MTSPISNPTAYDRPTLDGSLLPGLARIEECNGRQLEWQEQQAPGYEGAFVVYRGQKLVHITYGIELWLAEHFAIWDALEKTLLQGMTARPVNAYRLVDLRLKGLRIPQVSVATLPYQAQLGPGRWGYRLALQENKRLNLSGGVPKAPENERGQEIAQLDIANKHLSLAIDAQNLARRYNK